MSPPTVTPVTEWLSDMLKVYAERKRLASLDMTNVYAVEERAGEVRECRIVKYPRGH